MEEILQKYGLTFTQALMLVITFRKENTEDLIDFLKSKEFIDELGFVTNAGKEAAVDLILKIYPDRENSTQDNSLNELAAKLKEIFPKGKKSGTPYYWSEGIPLITKRLKIFFKKYGNYSFEDIIGAANKYVESFNGDYTYMKLLKYFIFKDTRGVDSNIEYTSELLNFIENRNEIDSSDWTSVIV